MSTPFLNDAFVRSALTRKIAALETSTRRSPSQKQVKQLNDLMGTYHGILSTPNMKPETALGVLSKIVPPSPGQPTTQIGQAISSVGDDAQLANIDLPNVLQKQQQMIQMMSNISKVLHDTAMAVIRKIG
jgi:hypothetical protein